MENTDRHQNMMRAQKLTLRFFFSRSVLQLLDVLRAEGEEGTRDFLESLEGLSKLSRLLTLFVPFFLFSLESVCGMKKVIILSGT